MKHTIAIKGKIRPILRDAKTNKIKWVGDWKHNLIPNVGLTAIINRLGNIGAKTNEGMITYGAVGNGNTTPNASDTEMENEIARKLLSTTTVVNQTLTIEVFFTTDEANGSITKFALFGEDATAALDSGTMFEYADFATPFTKVSTETLTIEIEIDISYI